MSKGISAFALAVLLVWRGDTLPQRPRRPTMPVAEQFERLHFRSIGPATMSGRIADLAVYEANPAIYYVAPRTAACGRRRATARLFTPLFQDEGLISIGDVAVSQTNPGPRLGRRRRVEQPPEHVVGRRRLQVDQRRHDVPAHGSRPIRSTSTESSSIRTTTTSCSSRRPARCSDPAATAASTRRPTAAAPGSRCSRSTTGRARTTS